MDLNICGKEFAVFVVANFGIIDYLFWYLNRLVASYQKIPGIRFATFQIDLQSSKLQPLSRTW